MGRSSEQHHKEAFLQMVEKKSSHYFLLKIWDGRYAAFWGQGFETDHCIAVAEHYIDESGSPFAFLSANLDEVREFINREEIKLVNQYPFIPDPNIV